MPGPERIVSVESINCTSKGMKYITSQLEVWDAIIMIARKHMMNSTSLPRKQLCEWGCMFNDLYLGKPSGDIYIDDKGVSDHEFFS